MQRLRWSCITYSKRNWRGYLGMDKSLWYFYEKFWNPSLYCLNAIEHNGIRFDDSVSEPAADKAGQDVRELEEQLEAWAPSVDNWGSFKQLSEFLYVFKCYPIPPMCGTLKAVRGNRERKQVTDEVGILWHASNIGGEEGEKLALIVKLRKAKRYGTYLRTLPSYCDSQGRIHTTLGPDTDTGRLSSRNPALQQIPKSDSYGIRRAFVPAPGNVFVVADYSQLEMYVLADLLVKQFGDYALHDDLLSGDIHSATARRTWPFLSSIPNLKLDDEGNKYRDKSKTLNYAVNYGKTATGLGFQIRNDGVPIGKVAAQKLLDQYYQAYPAIPRYQSWIKGYARKHGGVHTLLGRFRPLPEAQSTNEWEARAAGRQALNTPMQGGAADIVTAAMLRLNVENIPDLKDLGWYNADLANTGFFPVLQVHDELIFEGPEETAELARELIKHGMENPVKKQMAVKLKVDANIAHNWAEGK
jgi:DNA polymerase-1